MLLSTWLGDGSLETAVVTAAAAAATAHVALLNTVGIFGILGCLSRWGLRGWLPSGLGQNLGRGTPGGLALALCGCWQTESRLPGGFWQEDMGNGEPVLSVPCCFRRVGEIMPMPSQLWHLGGGIAPGFRLFRRSPGLGGIMCWLEEGLALVWLHLVTCSWTATGREVWGLVFKCNSRFGFWPLDRSTAVPHSLRTHLHCSSTGKPSQTSQGCA